MRSREIGTYTRDGTQIAMHDRFGIRPLARNDWADATTGMTGP